MACCAFAVFLLSQILWPVRGLYTRIAGERVYRDPAASWRPDGDTASARNPQPGLPGARFRKRVALLLLAELSLGGGIAGAASAGLWPAAEATDPSSISRTFDALHAPICSALGLREEDAR